MILIKETFYLIKVGQLYVCGVDGKHLTSRFGMKTSNVILAIYISEEEDVGVGVELGMAEALGKYILIVIPDEDWGKPINLMTYGIAHNFIKQSELAKFDFNKPTFNYYEGAVY